MAVVDFKTLKNGDAFSGVVCIKTLTMGKTRNGKDYMFGTCINQREQTQFKIWDSTVVSLLKAAVEAPQGFQTTLAQVNGTVSVYNGALDYSFGSCTFVADTPECKVADFLPTLDVETNYANFCAFINEKISEQWRYALLTVFNFPTTVFDCTNQSQTTILELFKSAWAAAGFHDAIRGGLVNHTYKMLKYAEVMLETNKELEPYKDLLYVGIIMHDIGKTQEMRDGNYMKNSFISHRVMGIEYLAMAKPTIVQYIGYDNYVRLESIILGHHDRFETPACTIWAYLVHLIDMLDTWATMAAEALITDKASVASSGEKYLTNDGKRLYF